MKDNIYTFEEIAMLVKPLIERYDIDNIYLFGSYARGEATPESDIDFLVYGGKQFKLKKILGLNTELHDIFKKDIDAFEINEVIEGTDFYDNIMKERVLIT